MRAICLLLCSLFFLPPLAGQSNLLRTLAREVCECMTEAPELIYPRLQAARCVENVSKNHPRQIKAEFELSVTMTAERQELGEMLIDLLTRDCGILRTLTPGRSEPELAYNDISLSQKPVLDKSSTPPPPDPPTVRIRDAARLQTLSGRITTITANRIFLELPSGERVEVTATGRQLRRFDLQAGRQVQLTCFDDWETDSDRVERCLVTVE